MPWRTVAGFFNRHVHDDVEVDLEVVWSLGDPSHRLSITAREGSLACQPLADGACVASRHTVVVGVLADLEGHSVGIGFDLGYSPVVRWMWIPEGLRGLALRWPSRLNASLVWSSPWWPAVGSAHRTTQCQMTPRPVLALCPQGALSTCGRSGAAVAAGIPRLPLPHDAQLAQDWQAGVGENGQGANSESRALIGFSEEQLDRLSVQVVYR